MIDEKIIKKLWKTLDKCKRTNDFPVAAVIFNGDKIISCGYNKRNKTKKTTDHAEIVAIEKANKRIKDWRLQNICIVVTMEPCEMCKAVIKESRIKKVYYLVKRLNYKKQYKSTQFEYILQDEENTENYKEKIQKFFSNKR